MATNKRLKMATIAVLPRLVFFGAGGGVSARIPLLILSVLLFFSRSFGVWKG